MDLFTRFIVGVHVSKTLRTFDSTIPALEMALEKYNPSKAFIFHSDGGGQYYCKDFLKLTKHYKIKK